MSRPSSAASYTLQKSSTGRMYPGCFSVSCRSQSFMGFSFGQPGKYFCAQFQAAGKFFRYLPTAYPLRFLVCLLKCFRSIAGRSWAGSGSGFMDLKNFRNARFFSPKTFVQNLPRRGSMELSAHCASEYATGVPFKYCPSGSSFWPTSHLTASDPASNRCRTGISALKFGNDSYRGISGFCPGRSRQIRLRNKSPSRSRVLMNGFANQPDFR